MKNLNAVACDRLIPDSCRAVGGSLFLPSPRLNVLLLTDLAIHSPCPEITCWLLILTTVLGPGVPRGIKGQGFLTVSSRLLMTYTLNSICEVGVSISVSKNIFAVTSERAQARTISITRPKIPDSQAVRR